MPIVSVKNPDINDDKYQPTGATDGGHVLLTCSACGVPLVDIWINHPEDDIDWTFRANCAHCGDKSYEKKVHGTYLLGGTDYSVPESFDDADGVIIVNTAKVKTYVQKRS